VVVERSASVMTMIRSSPWPYVDQIWSSPVRTARSLDRTLVVGASPHGAVVPSTKQLAESYQIAMSSAARALALLRDEGWIVSRPAKPALVAPHPPT
jgi:DNA-binding GntR family transcriptional regulator